MDGIEQIVPVEWFCQAAERSSLHRTIFDVRIEKGCDKHRRNRTAGADKQVMEFKAGHAWHLNVQDEARRLGQTVGLQELSRRPECPDPESKRFHHVSHGGSDRVIVVDDGYERCIAQRGLHLQGMK